MRSPRPRPGHCHGPDRERGSGRCPATPSAWQRGRLGHPAPEGAKQKRAAGYWDRDTHRGGGPIGLLSSSLSRRLRSIRAAPLIPNALAISRLAVWPGCSAIHARIWDLLGRPVMDCRYHGRAAGGVKSAHAPYRGAGLCTSGALPRTPEYFGQADEQIGGTAARGVKSGGGRAADADLSRAQEAIADHETHRHHLDDVARFGSRYGRLEHGFVDLRIKGLAFFWRDHRDAVL